LEDLGKPGGTEIKRDTSQLLVYAEDVNLLGKSMGTKKRNTGTL
jgi:hypothetical protein